MAGIFISYRRSDSDIAAGRLTDDLSEIFGRGSIFRDVDTLDVGEEYNNALDDALNSCAALIAVIGPRWSALTDDGGRRRLEDPNDWVRMEISRGLARGIRVIPVLISATMPQEGDLPIDLKPLLKRQALELSDRHWREDLELLTRALEKVPGITRRGPPDRTTPLTKRHRMLLAVAAVVILAISGWFGWRYWNAHVSAGPSDLSRTPNTHSAETKPEQGRFSTPAPSDVIFSDDFSSATLGSLWQPVSGDWFVKNGVLNALGAHYTGSHKREWAAISLVKEIPNNCSVSFRTRLIDGSTAELMLHLSNNRYIRVYIYEIDQAVMFGEGTFIEDNRPGSIGIKEVLESIGGGPTLAEHGFPIKLGVWYTITTTAADNEYVVKVGGQKLIDYVDKMNKLNNEGTIGFLTNGQVQFDDLVVTARSPGGD
jgi:hypothetical protein